MGYGPRMACWTMAAWLAASLPARPVRADSPGPPVRITVEIDWKAPELPALPDEAAPPPAPTVDLDVPGGRVLGAIAWRADSLGGDEIPSQGGTCRLGVARRGTVRVRVEASSSGTIVIRAGGQATAFSLGRLMETAQKTGPTAPVAVQVTRLGWDVLEVELAPVRDGERTSDGVVAPESTVPVRVGFNVLTAEPTEGVARVVAELRGRPGSDEILWSYDQAHFVASNVAPGATPAVLLPVPAPREEGTYVLSVEATWEPTAANERGSRIGRLIGRRRSPGPATIGATRDVTFAVLGPDRPRSEPPGAATAVESIDLARVRGPRPSASGRAPAPVGGQAGWTVPEAALVEAAFRDRVRGWMPWGADAASLPAAAPEGMPWVALGLHLPHPGRLHRLTLTVSGGEPQGLGVGLIAGGTGGNRRGRVLLDACVARGAGSDQRTYSWPVWPDSTDPVLVIVNRGNDTVQLGTVKLEEIAGELAPAAVIEPEAEPARRVGLVLSRLADLDRFGPRGDPVALGRNLSAYLAHVGATTVVLPDSLAAERSRRRALGGQADTDPIGPDRLEILLKLLAQRKQEALLEVDLNGNLPGLPPLESAESARRGLVRINARGRADDPAYSALNPAVRAAVLARCGGSIAPRRTHPNLAGLVVRLGPGPTLAGPTPTGLDDETFARFVGAMLDPQAARTVPGRDASDPGRFAARGQYLAGPGKAPWLAWRAREVGTLYKELAEGLQAAAPGSLLAIVTPGLDDGPAGRAARLADESGESPVAAWKAIGLDLDQWPRSPEGMVLLRGVTPGLGPLAEELATHPDLDAPVARRVQRGLVLGCEPNVAPPGGALILRAVATREADEPLGHALAALDAHWMLVDLAAVAGREGRLAAMARILRALPAHAEPQARPLLPEKGVSARVWTQDGRSLMALANDTPYPITVEALVRGGGDQPVDDLGRAMRLEPRPVAGGRSVVLELPPFGAAALRVGGEARFEPVNVFQPELAETQYRALSARLERMVQGLPATLPPNPGFEDASPRGAVVAEIGGAAPGAAGWSVQGTGAAASLDATQKHGGSQSLRFEAPNGPASLAGEGFAPPQDRELEVRAWMRADHEGTTVRVWIEGEADGKPVAQRGDLKIDRSWTEKRLRVAGLPDGGLQRLRLRFELPEPATLWIDDMSVRAARAAEPDARAQLVLVKAQQAYRAGRIADFARLANSPLARAAGAPAPPVRTGQAAGASASRRLR